MVKVKVKVKVMVKVNPQPFATGGASPPCCLDFSAKVLADMAVRSGSVDILPLPLFRCKDTTSTLR